MKIKAFKLSSKHFVANVPVSTLLKKVEELYGKNMSQIEYDYIKERIPEEYREYMVSAVSDNETYLDNIVLFTEENFEDISSELEINNFIVADGFTRLIIFNKLLTAKDFILKEIDLENLTASRESYKGKFVKETNMPACYLDVVIAIINSKFKKDIKKFENEFLNSDIGVTIVSVKSQDCMKEYISNKNMSNKNISSQELFKKLNYKLKPYSKTS